MADQDRVFRHGHVWLSPRGTFYRVEDVSAGQATLRVGLQGNGRRIHRDAERTANWVFVAPLVTPELIRRAENGQIN